MYRVKVIKDSIHYIDSTKPQRYECLKMSYSTFIRQCRKVHVLRIRLIEGAVPPDINTSRRQSIKTDHNVCLQLLPVDRSGISALISKTHYIQEETLLKALGMLQDADVIEQQNVELDLDFLDELPTYKEIE